ncbi:hypothetical protein [Algoriphagus sp.]|uniref:hypothetical protein n=1 Tax=Algoriphagus sp. TaxID=1872435 RepID=UPI00391B36AE
MTTNYPITLRLFFILCLPIFLSFSFSNGKDPQTDDENPRIRPYVKNPSYWQYKNQPVLLLGGSSDDNLFQQTSPELIEELDRLVQFGGNYLRCTMSSRDSGNVFAFAIDPKSGLFDLNKWNEEYWSRFEYFLSETQKREIIVQVEIWETYDFYSRSSHVIDGQTAWGRNPFNPKNNINYTAQTSGLLEDFTSNGFELINSFFNTVLPLVIPFDFEKTYTVLAFQQKFVDKLLSISLKYDHVLYVIDNETNADPKWSIYWSQYIKDKAEQAQIQIEVTEMWDTFDPTGGAVPDAIVQDPANHFFTLRSGVANTLYDTENFSFVDISNHNAQVGETHYETGLYVWNEIQNSGKIRPITNTKIYGNLGGWAGNMTDAQERFWRNIFAGSSSVRFHRPTVGIGHSDLALSHINSMRMLTETIDIFTCKPSNGLMTGKEPNEAYCLANENSEILVFFPKGGEVVLNPTKGRYEVQWMDILSSIWLPSTYLDLPGNLITPSDGFWAVKVKKID